MHQVVKAYQLIMSCKDSTQLFQCLMANFKATGFFFITLYSKGKLGHIYETDHFFSAWKGEKEGRRAGKRGKHWIFNNRHSKCYYYHSESIDEPCFVFGLVSCLHRLNWHLYIVLCFFQLAILFMYGQTHVFTPVYYQQKK